MDGKLQISDILIKAKLVLYTVLEFLDSDDLSNLYQQLKCQPNIHHTNIITLLQAYIYIRLHMNGTDRSYYYFVYDSSAFRRIEKSIIARNVQSTNNFKQFFHLRNYIHNYIVKGMKKADCLEVADDLYRIFSDPDIPTLRLLRQTVGIGCKSPFQNFLVSMSEETYLTPSIQYPTLSEFYQKRTDQAYIRQFLKIDRSKHKTTDFLKIKKLRFSPYHIKCQEMESYFLPDNEMHNFLVALFAMADLVMQSTIAYINGIEDPYYRLMEFCLRYAIYRNFVLAIQDKFAFVFEIYSSLYWDIFLPEQVQVPTFSFWRPALGKWLLYMSKYHEECTEIVNLYTLQKRHQNLIQAFDTLPEQDKPQDYSAIRSSLDLLNVENFCKVDRIENRQIYELIEEELVYCANEYQEYMMDLSLDEVTVNWCGYSKQRLGVPYNEYEHRTLVINYAFVNELAKFPHKAESVVKLMQMDMKYVDKNSYYNQSIIAHSIFFIAELVAKISHNRMQFNFQWHNFDEKIKICNEKAKIPLQIQNEKSRQLYQIKPLLQEELSQYIQMKSIQTMDNSQDEISQESGQLEGIEYRSEGDMFEESQQSKFLEIGHFMEDQSKLQSQFYFQKEEHLSQNVSKDGIKQVK